MSAPPHNSTAHRLLPLHGSRVINYSLQNSKSGAPVLQASLPRLHLRGGPPRGCSTFSTDNLMTTHSASSPAPSLEAGPQVSSHLSFDDNQAGLRARLDTSELHARALLARAADSSSSSTTDSSSPPSCDDGARGGAVTSVLAVEVHRRRRRHRLDRDDGGAEAGRHGGLVELTVEDMVSMIVTVPPDERPVVAIRVERAVAARPPMSTASL